MKTLCTLAAFSAALVLTSCSLTQQGGGEAADAPVAEVPPAQADTESTPEGKEDAPAPAEVLVPTEEQQQAALDIIPGVTDGDYDPAPDTPALWNDSTAQPTTQSAPALPTGGLRMGSIIPQEDPASTGDAPAPAANSAERFGLRSPKMPGKLPMGIDGKLKSEQ